MADATQLGPPASSSAQRQARRCGLLALCDHGVVDRARWEMHGELEADLIGMIGRISVPVPAGGSGEIIISVRGGSEAFTAYTLGDEALPRNARAAVVEKTGARTVLVTAV
jgi:hypothetical protein